MAEVASKDPLTRRVYRRRLQFTAQRYPGARHRLRICGRGAYLRRDRTETGMVNAVLNQLARRAAGGVCLCLALLLRLPFGCERVPQRDVFLVRDRARRDSLVDIEHRA